MVSCLAVNKTVHRQDEIMVFGEQKAVHVYSVKSVTFLATSKCDIWLMCVSCCSEPN